MGIFKCKGGAGVVQLKPRRYLIFIKHVAYSKENDAEIFFHVLSLANPKMSTSSIESITLDRKLPF